MSEESAMIMKVGDNDIEMTLDQLLNFDVTNIDPFRGYGTFAKGLFLWEVESCELGKQETNKGDVRGTVNFQFTCKEVIKLAPKQEVDPEELVDATHFEKIFIMDGRRDIGKVMAILVDSGFCNGAGLLGEHLKTFKDSKFRFIAAIGHRKDKDDKDKIYANIDLRTVQPTAETLAKTA